MLPNVHLYIISKIVFLLFSFFFYSIRFKKLSRPFFYSSTFSRIKSISIKCTVTLNRKTEYFKNQSSNLIPFPSYSRFVVKVCGACCSNCLEYDGLFDVLKCRSNFYPTTIYKPLLTKSISPPTNISALDARFKVSCAIYKAI